jgi:hypothetical protein
VRRCFHFERVIGVDYGGKKHPDYFRTWNGADLVYILDEDGNLDGITTRGQLDPRYAPPTPVKLAKRNVNKKRRDKLAKRSRKRNRKR